jgi:peptidase inhibitor I9
MRSLLAFLTIPLALAAPVENAAEAKSNYIVVMKPQGGVRSREVEFASSALQGIEPFHHYNIGDFRGFAASLTASQAKALGNEPKVENIPILLLIQY